MMTSLHVLLPRLPAVGQRAPPSAMVERHRCWLPICAVCARDYRPGPIAQLHALAHAKAYPGPRQVATIYLELFPPGSLAVADLPRTREMFRKRLDRAGFKGAIVAGGIEVAWQENHQRWLLHAQVLAIGVAAHAWQQLEAALEAEWHRGSRQGRTAARPRRAALLLRQVRDLSPTRTPSASVYLRIAWSNWRRGGRDIASRTSCSLMAPVVAAADWSSTSSFPRPGGLAPPERHRQTTKLRNAT